MDKQFEKAAADPSDYKENQFKCAEKHTILNEVLVLAIGYTPQLHSTRTLLPHQLYWIPFQPHLHPLRNLVGK